MYFQHYNYILKYFLGLKYFITHATYSCEKECMSSISCKVLSNKSTLYKKQQTQI